MQCPKCGSENVIVQREQTASVGASTNKVVIEQPRKSKGCLYWMIIGFWWEPTYWLCIGWWWKLFFGGKSRSGFNIHADKTINHTMAVCQNCGKTWKVS